MVPYMYSERVGIVEEQARTAGRPRDREVERRILVTTQDLLIEHGFASTTIGDIARIASCSRAAIYRRWPSKIELVIAAMRALHAPVIVPDTGSLRKDLLACAMHYASADERSTRVLASLLSEIGRDRALRDAAHEAIGSPPAEALATVMRRWMGRGEIAPTAPLDLVAGIVPAIAFRSVTLRQGSLDPATVTALVDHVLIPALTSGHLKRSAMP